MVIHICKCCQWLENSGSDTGVTTASYSGPGDLLVVVRSARLSRLSVSILLLSVISIIYNYLSFAVYVCSYKDKKTQRLYFMPTREQGIMICRTPI